MPDNIIFNNDEQLQILNNDIIFHNQDYITNQFLESIKSAIELDDLLCDQYNSIIQNINNINIEYIVEQ